MIIVCPQCDRRYLTNDADFKEIGRNVRCSGCGHEWFYEAAVEPDDTEPLYADVDPVHSLETVQRKKSYKPLWVLLFLGLILAGIYSERSRLYEAFPQTAKLFQLMGFEKKARHQALIIENLTPLYLEDDPHKSVVVMGEVRNMGEETHQIPQLTIQVKGPCRDAPWLTRLLNQSKDEKAACVVEEWTHVWSEARLPPGETIKFQTQPKKVKAGIDLIEAHF